jgi:hypothetical protein
MRFLIQPPIAKETREVICAWLGDRPTEPTGLGAGEVWRNGTDVDGSTLAITGSGNT